MGIRKALIAIFAVTAAAISVVGASSSDLLMPNIVYLRYADGVTQPDDHDIPKLPHIYNYCSGKIPPAYVCTAGATAEECQKKTEAGLSMIFADFNVKFTQEEPSDTPLFYTASISSGGGKWCGYDAGGRAPSNCQVAIINATGAVANIFIAGDNLDYDAKLIAHELGHVMGLTHVTDDHDIMYGGDLSNAIGFLNQESTVSQETDNHDDHGCFRTTQNSWRMIRDVLGLR